MTEAKKIREAAISLLSGEQMETVVPSDMDPDEAAEAMSAIVRGGLSMGLSATYTVRLHVEELGND